MIIQATFGSRADTKAFDKKMTQREKEAGKSFHDTMVVVANILEAFKKLKRISDEIFGNEDVSVSKAKYVVWNALTEFTFTSNRFYMMIIEWLVFFWSHLTVRIEL